MAQRFQQGAKGAEAVFAAHKRLPSSVGAAQFERGAMKWGSKNSGANQPIAAFKSQAGLPDDKFVPWQKLQLGGVPQQRGAFTERRATEVNAPPKREAPTPPRPETRLTPAAKAAQGRFRSGAAPMFQTRAAADSSRVIPTQLGATATLGESSPGGIGGGGSSIVLLQRRAQRKSTLTPFSQTPFSQTPFSQRISAHVSIARVGSQKHKTVPRRAFEKSLVLQRSSQKWTAQDQKLYEAIWFNVFDETTSEEQATEAALASVNSSIAERNLAKAAEQAKAKEENDERQRQLAVEKRTEEERKLNLERGLIRERESMKSKGLNLNGRAVCSDTFMMNHVSYTDDRSMSNVAEIALFRFTQRDTETSVNTVLFVDETAIKFLLQSVVKEVDAKGWSALPVHPTIKDTRLATVNMGVTAGVVNVGPSWQGTKQYSSLVVGVSMGEGQDLKIFHLHACN